MLRRKEFTRERSSNILNAINRARARLRPYSTVIVSPYDANQLKTGQVARVRKRRYVNVIKRYPRLFNVGKQSRVQTCDALSRHLIPATQWASDWRTVIVRIIGITFLVAFIYSLTIDDAAFEHYFQISAAEYKATGEEREQIAAALAELDRLDAIQNCVLLAWVLVSTVAFSARFTDYRSKLSTLVSFNPLRMIRVLSVFVTVPLKLLPKRFRIGYHDSEIREYYSFAPKYTAKLNRRDAVIRDSQYDTVQYVSRNAHRSIYLARGEATRRLVMLIRLVKHATFGNVHWSSLDHLPHLRFSGDLSYDVLMTGSVDVFNYAKKARNMFSTHMTRLENTTTASGVIDTFGCIADTRYKDLLVGHYLNEFSLRSECIPDDCKIVDVALYSRGYLLNRVPALAIELSTKASTDSIDHEAIRKVILEAVYRCFYASPTRAGLNVDFDSTEYRDVAVRRTVAAMSSPASVPAQAWLQLMPR